MSERPPGQTMPECSAATPREELERQIMDVNLPKNEREWWAQREIERLRMAEGYPELPKEIAERDAEIERLCGIVEFGEAASRQQREGFQAEIERLRGGNERQHKRYGDEIERLRSLLANSEMTVKELLANDERLRAERTGLIDANDNFAREIERLQADNLKGTEKTIELYERSMTEVERLKAALREIADTDLPDGVSTQDIARAALEGK